MRGAQSESRAARQNKRIRFCRRPGETNNERTRHAQPNHRGGTLTHRGILTLKWRPTGTPTRPLDDFVEVYEQTKPAEPVPPRQVERRSIGRRLENWGMWANMDNRGGGSGADCMTGVICDSMRRNAIGEIGPAAAVNDRIDVPDAERINVAITKIPEADRWVLHWTYVVCAKPWGVAGACGFPAHEYDARLRQAQAAIESVVEKHMEKQG
jgi:hypothetical protein